MTSLFPIRRASTDYRHPFTTPIIRQGRLEAACSPENDSSEEPIHSCLKRIWLKEHDPSGGFAFADGGRARDIGTYTGELCEKLLERYARTQVFPDPEIVLAIADATLAEPDFRRLPRARRAEIRAAGLAFAHGFLSRLDDEDDPLEGAPPIWVLRRQHEFKLTRTDEGRTLWTITVRPDLVVATETALVAYEFSTSSRSTNVPDVRAALNYWALLLEQRRRTNWAMWPRILTRVEQLAFGAGYNVELSQQVAASWREEIGSVADSLAERAFPMNPVVDRCLSCQWLTQCSPDLSTDTPAADLQIFRSTSGGIEWSREGE